MKILGVDTSSSMCSVALLEENQILIELCLELDRQHSSNLVPMIGQLLTTTSLKLSDIDGYAVGLGPGSFTGIRVGVTTIKGLTLVDKKKVVGVSSLLALACNGIGGPYPVAPLVDAKRNLVYFAWYQADKFGKPKQLIAPTLGTLEEALSKINQPTLFIGDAAGMYQKEILRHKKKKAFFSDCMNQFPRASSVGRIALEKFQKGKVDTAESLTPMYLYSRYCSIRGNR